jgi:hypothetical protein
MHSSQPYRKAFNIQPCPVQGAQFGSHKRLIRPESDKRIPQSIEDVEAHIDQGHSSDDDASGPENVVAFSDDDIHRSDHGEGDSAVAPQVSSSVDETSPVPLAKIAAKFLAQKPIDFGDAWEIIERARRVREPICVYLLYRR